MNRADFQKVIAELDCRLDLAKIDFDRAIIKGVYEPSSKAELDCRMFDVAHNLRVIAEIATATANKITGKV
jgi:hypothetical protein